MNKVFKMLNFLIFIIAFAIPKISVADEIKNLNHGFKLSSIQNFMIAQDLIKFEGDKYHCPYAGKNGAITIGVGFTLSVIDDVEQKLPNGKVITYKQTRLWPYDKINIYFESAGVHKMTPGGYKKLEELRDEINLHLKSASKSPFRSQASWSYCLNKNDNKEEMYRLLKYSIDQHAKIMVNKANNLNINLSKLDSLAIVMVMDMVYRAGTGIVLGDNTPKVNQALRNQDYLTLLKEFYAYSNKNALEQNDLRNALLVAQSLALLKNDKERNTFKKFISENNKALKVSKRINTLLDSNPNSMDATDIAKIQTITVDKMVVINS